MKQYKLVIFDVDGTLLDTSEGILNSVKYVIDKVRREMPSDDVLKTYIGPPIQKSFARTYGVDGLELDNMVSLFRNQYKDYDLLKAKPYNGMKELFAALYGLGIKVAIATYKRQDYAESIIKHFEFDSYTDNICGSDFEGKLTKSDIIQNAIKNSGVIDKDSIVMVGDTELDAEGAENLSLDFIAVTYGFGYKNKCDAKQKNTVAVATNPYEIMKFLIGDANSEN